jgi:catechol 2,3-dioxygenase-like lactoylglutathione lyase family enzyme
MPSTRRAAEIQEVRTIGIPVTDQDQATRFYIETLGFLSGHTSQISARPRHCHH